MVRLFLFFILLSEYGGIRNEAEPPWDMLSLSAFRGRCGISALGRPGPIGREGFPLTFPVSPRCPHNVILFNVVSL